MQCPNPGHFLSSLAICMVWLLEFGIDTWLRLRYSYRKFLVLVHFSLLAGAVVITVLSYDPQYWPGPIESAVSALGFCVVGVRLALRTTITRQLCSEIDPASRTTTFSPWKGFLAAGLALVILGDPVLGAPSGMIVALLLPLAELIPAIERICGTDRTIAQDEKAKWRLAVLDGWFYGIGLLARVAYAVLIALLGQDTRGCISPAAVTLMLAIEALHSILRLAFSLPCLWKIRQHTPATELVQERHIQEFTESVQALDQAPYSCFLKPCCTAAFSPKYHQQHERRHLIFRFRESEQMGMDPTDSRIREQYLELILREIISQEERRMALARMLTEQDHTDIINTWFNFYEGLDPSVYGVDLDHFGETSKRFVRGPLQPLIESWSDDAQQLYYDLSF